MSDIRRSEVVVVSRSEGENKSESGDLGHSGEDAVEVHAPLLCVAIRDQAAFEFVYAAVALALDREDHVAPHDVGVGRDVTLAKEFKGAEFK